MNRVRIDVESFQYRYPVYIDKVLNALELASLAFMKDARNYNVRPTNHPAITPDNEVINNDYRGRMQITMPGIYQGVNAGFVKHECKGLYDQYIQGWKNKGIVHQMYKDFESRHNIVKIEFSDEQNAIEYDNQNQNTQLQEADSAQLAVCQEFRLILEMFSHKQGEYPGTALEEAKCIIPKRNQRFYDQLEERYEAIDSDEDDTSNKDPGDVEY